MDDFNYLGNDNGSIIGGDDGAINWHIREQRYMQDTRRLQQQQLQQMQYQSGLMQRGVQPSGNTSGAIAVGRGGLRTLVNFVAMHAVIWVVMVAAFMVLSALL